MKAILYIGHGTRSKIGAEEARSFIQRVMNRISIPIQEVSFLELTDPLIDDGFRRCVERGATDVTVVPLFLLAAGHIKEDIPNALSSLRERYPHVSIKVRDPFGVQDILLDGIAELVRETVTNLASNDSILIVGRGSSDPSIHSAFEEISFGIRQRLGVENVLVCYLAATEPRLDEGLETISKNASGNIVVIPYLLFSGLLLNEVSQKVRKKQNQGQLIVHTGQLSKHRVIEDIVIQRAME